MAFIVPSAPMRPSGRPLRAVPRGTSSPAMLTPAMTLRVLVSGATGRTGRLAFAKLAAHADVEPVGFVRSNRRAESVGLAPDSLLVEGDVTHGLSVWAAMAAVDTLVILTSAVPRPGEDGNLGYDSAGMPELVDWQGGRNQIDAAVEAGVRHVVFVGSMGGTEENNVLNRIGNGNILRYKRRAEEYLIASGLPYTIINPGGLLNEPEGERELVVGSGDDLFRVFQRGNCGIPRGDIARVVAAAILDNAALFKAFDVVAKPKGEGIVTTDGQLSTLFLNAGSRL